MGTGVNVRAVEVRSDVRVAGSITFEGEPLLNQIQGNIVWSATSNMMGLPTDCPQRDER